jgi:hypothetical protein
VQKVRGWARRGWGGGLNVLCRRCKGEETVLQVQKVHGGGFLLCMHNK